MKPTVTVDMTQFRAAASELFRRSRRTWAFFVNSQLYWLAIRAIRETEKADPTQISWVLGQIGTKVSKSRKTGEYKARGRMVKEDSFAARIINARRRDAPLPLLWGAELTKAATALINARVKSVGFVRSGWLEAIRVLKRAMSKDQQYTTFGSKKALVLDKPDERQRGRPKGWAAAVQTVFGFVVEGVIANTALREAEARDVAARGLQKAIAIQTQDMKEELARRMQATVNSMK